MNAERSSGLADLVARLGADSRSAMAFPELPELATLRAQWDQLHAESRLRITLQQAPAEGGPLNSAVLVHRMLTLMQETSPGYLRHFVAYADALSWLEQSTPTTPPNARRAGGSGRR